MNLYFKKKVAFQVIVTFFILILCIFMYAYLFFKDMVVWKTLFFEITPVFFDTIEYSVWHYFSKIHLALLASFIFLTTIDRWKYALIVFIFIGYYQVYGAFNVVGYGVILSETLPFVVFPLHLMLLFYIDKKLNRYRIEATNVKQINILKELLSLQHYKVKNDTIQRKINNQDISFKTIFSLDRRLKELQTLSHDITSRYTIYMANANTKNVFLFFLVLSLPLVTFSYKWVPVTLNEISLINLKLIIPEGDFQTYVWLISFKLTIFVLLFIWFVTSKQLWRYAVLIHLSVVGLQLYQVVIGSETIFDEVEVFKAIPIIAPLLVLIYFLAKWISYKTRAEYLNELVNEKINVILELLGQSQLGGTKLILQFQDLKSQKETMKEEDYFEQLNKLKKAIENKGVIL
ncbi:hypothetical protein [Cellulophaga sp. Z1A5H]|uniref:hypothetical protein n=1 Tax=Cellulophaga sp. Z1A5H TaxID=2687291 RepID=UPI0013FDAB79|nr:hypothetical protein [Cellulophaga sp. Z1A5H]